jgi:hypothetical protein
MRRGQPARAIERRGHVLIPHALIDVVARKAARHLVDIVRRARERERIAVALTHQRVEARQVRDRAGHNDEAEDDLIGADDLAAKEELRAARAVERPAEDGGRGKQQQADRKN